MSLYPASRPMRLERVPSGREGIRRTLQAMSEYVLRFKKDVGIRELASVLVQDLPQYDIAGEIRALHAFVRDCIRYTNDIAGVETLQTPRYTLEVRVGDCDDKSTLLASLLEAIGKKTRFVAVGPQGSGVSSHVLVEVRAGRTRDGRPRWVPLETIKPVEAGWFPKGMSRNMVAHN